ncbi:MAG TPA: efflux RND transporter periplasmic adaptor subunit [Trebonia sp.]
MVSKTASRGPEAGQHAEILAAGAPQGRSRGRGRWVALGAVVVVAAGAAAAWRAGAFSPAATSGTGQQAAPPATAAVTRQDLSAVTPVTATLGYAGSYTVTGQGTGTLTWLPSSGRVIGQGQALYRVDNGSPVVLLYGSVPDWRTMDEGITGQDVSQLNHDLVALGYANRADVTALGWDYYSWETAVGVQNLEEHLGVTSPSGSLSLGQVVFAPQALRVSQVTGSLGGSATGPVLTATSDQHTVTIQLDASQQSQVQVGDKVTVTLPDGTTTPGVVSSVGAVASTTPGSAGSGSTTTIPVQVMLTDPKAAGTLEQAPVTVNITTESMKNALAVPVTALVAQGSGGYQVEVAGPGNTRRWVPVQPGIFDDASGLVQVTGALTPGQRVVVASS